MSNAGPGWKSLEPPHASAKPVAGGVVYYQYRDSTGEMHVVDDRTLIPSDVKHVQKIIMHSSPVAAPPAQSQMDMGATVLKSAQTASQEAFSSVASTLGVTPPPPISEVAQQPITAKAALVPTVPPMQSQAFSPGLTAVAAVGLLLGLSNRHTRPFCMRILVIGISMAALGSVYFNWANAHGLRGPGSPAMITPATVVEEAEHSAKVIQQKQQDEVEMLDAIDHGSGK